MDPTKLRGRTTDNATNCQRLSTLLLAGMLATGVFDVGAQEIKLGQWEITIKATFPESNKTETIGPEKQCITAKDLASAEWVPSAWAQVVPPCRLLKETKSEGWTLQDTVCPVQGGEVRRTIKGMARSDFVQVSIGEYSPAPTTHGSLALQIDMHAKYVGDCK